MVDEYSGSSKNHDFKHTMETDQLRESYSSYNRISLYLKFIGQKTGVKYGKSLRKECV